MIGRGHRTVIRGVLALGAAMVSAAALAQPSDPQPEPTKPQPPPKPTEDPAPRPPQAAAPKPPVAFPHPLITELLYAVPTGPDGDANQDGKRDATGDEFVELINPHDRPINLRGYRISDRRDANRSPVRFTFPSVELPPGGVVVVFNGHGQKWTGPVGDSKAAPTGPNEKFNNALVFTMKADSEKAAFTNSGDWCLLSDPGGNPVECLWWGKVAETRPEKGLIEELPLTSKGSVQRKSLSGDFVPHLDLADTPFSPGVFAPARELAAPARTEKPSEPTAPNPPSNAPPPQQPPAPVAPHPVDPPQR